MNMFDEARSFQSMIRSRNLTQRRLADFLGVSQPYIANKLRLLSYSVDAQERIITGGLSERHARTILRLPDEKSRIDLIEKCILGKLSVAECEIAVDCMLDAKKQLPKEFSSYREIITDFSDKLESALSILRRYGIKARCIQDEDEYNLYLSLNIEK